MSEFPQEPTSIITQDDQQATLAPVATLDRDSLNMMFKLAQKFANSSIVPTQYQRKPDDCFVACELAARLAISPLVVMQNLYIVQGRPGWSGQGAIALINGSGKFTPLDFCFTGERNTDTWGCYAQAVRKSDGKIVRGSEVTLKLAKDEGWYDKKGSKWQTMPEQMLMYRAGAFFSRVHCPNLLMGYQTIDEIQDVRGYEQPQKEKVVFDV